MPVENLSFSLTTVQWLLMVAIAIYAWWVGRQSATLAEVVALRERVVELEVRMKQVPNQEALTHMVAKLAHLDANLVAMAAALQPINANLDRINQYLLNQKT